MPGKKGADIKNSDNLFSSNSNILIQKQDIKDKPLQVLSEFIEVLQKDYGVSDAELNQVLTKQLSNLFIPENVLACNKLTILEAVIKYLKEEKYQDNGQLMSLLGRSQSTVILTYNRARSKMPEKFKVKSGVYEVPVKIFQNRKLSPLEVVVNFFKAKGLQNHTIGNLLNRDDRTIWTVNDRIKNKLKNEKRS